jgi:hypothetical protein
MLFPRRLSAATDVSAQAAGNYGGGLSSNQPENRPDKTHGAKRGDPDKKAFWRRKSKTRERTAREPWPSASRGLLRFAHKTSKNRLSGDFLPCKLPGGFSQAALAARGPDNQDFCGAKYRKNPQANRLLGVTRWYPRMRLYIQILSA